MAGDKPTMDLYHYTDERSKESILQDGKINPSTGSTLCGAGTYMTKVPPTEGKKQIATNNFGKSRTAEEKAGAGKMDVAFKVKVKADEVTSLTKNDKVEGRSVYKVVGGIDLNEHEFEVMKVPDKPKTGHN